LRFVKPLDEVLLHEACQRYPNLVTVEDASVQGGFGSAVLEFMAREGYKNEVRILGIPDKIVEHGTPKELHRECAYDAEAIAEAVREMLTAPLTAAAKKIRLANS
jgi:1-deoxy-D-xylulose-5-phosphate synthase